MGAPKIFYDLFPNYLPLRAIIWNKILFALRCIPNFFRSKIDVWRIRFLIDSTILSLRNIFEINCILSLKGWPIVPQHQMWFSSIFIVIITGMIWINRDGFFVKNLGVSGREVSQSISKLNIVFLQVSRFHSLIIWILFIKLILVICIVASTILISENYVVNSDIFRADRLLSSFNLIVWEFFFKLRLVCCIIYVVLIPKTEVVLSPILVSFFIIIQFVLGIFGNVFRWLLYYK